MPAIDLNKIINPCYIPAFYDKSRWLILYGGAGSGKSWFAGQKVVCRVISEPGHRAMVTRKVAKTLKQSVWQLIKDVIGSFQMTHLWEPLEHTMELTYRPNGSKILFMGLDDVEKLKSIQRPTLWWHEEATEDIPIDLTQANLRLRGETPGYKQNIVTYNPVSVRHWLRKRFHETPHENERVFKTTFRDNQFLDSEYRAELERLTGNDATVYKDGDWGVLKGAIYPMWQVPPVWPVEFDDLIYGVDFGFNNPMALTEIGIHDGEYYLTELLYERGLTTPDLIRRMEALGIPDWAPIYCDAAEPDRIEEMCQAGFNAIPANKGPGSVRAGISMIQDATIWTRLENENINAENGSYVWATDKDGNPMDEPKKENDHAMDSIRYPITSHGIGGFSIS